VKLFLYILPLLLFGCTHKPKQVKDPFTEKLKLNDHKLREPQPGEWMYEHHENGQTFKQYQAIKPVSPNQKQNKIYLQPIGKFSEEQIKVISFTANYLQIFFGLKTIVSEPISDNIFPDSARRILDGSTQLLAPYILGILKKEIPSDAIVVMAITEKDLYPKPSWNYVFGLASLKERIGVSSIFRYSEKEIDSSNYSVCLERLIKTSSHEIGHMFSIPHCTYAICVMNGSNSLTESDAQPNRLCSQCLSKLSWNLKFDILKRIKELETYFKKHGLTRDVANAREDLNLLKE